MATSCGVESEPLFTFWEPIGLVECIGATPESRHGRSTNCRTLPAGKHTKKGWKDPPCYQWVNPQFQWAIFNSYVSLPEGLILIRNKLFGQTKCLLNPIPSRPSLPVSDFCRHSKRAAWQRNWGAPTKPGEQRKPPEEQILEWTQSHPPKYDNHCNNYK